MWDHFGGLLNVIPREPHRLPTEQDRPTLSRVEGEAGVLQE